MISQRKWRHEKSMDGRVESPADSFGTFGMLQFFEPFRSDDSPRFNGDAGALKRIARTNQSGNRAGEFFPAGIVAPGEVLIYRPRIGILPGRAFAFAGAELA